MEGNIMEQKKLRKGMMLCEMVGRVRGSDEWSWLDSRWEKIWEGKKDRTG